MLQSEVQECPLSFCIDVCMKQFCGFLKFNIPHKQHGHSGLFKQPRGPPVSTDVPPGTQISDVGESMPSLVVSLCAAHLPALWITVLTYLYSTVQRWVGTHGLEVDQVVQMIWVRFGAAQVDLFDHKRPPTPPWALMQIRGLIHCYTLFLLSLSYRRFWTECARRITIILIAPHWPRQTWFMVLISQLREGTMDTGHSLGPAVEGHSADEWKPSVHIHIA